jgi:hypothetical protein
VNCDALCRRLLALEHPDLPPPDLCGHLAACAACRDWHARLLLMERLAADLPVPAPAKKAAFLSALGGRPSATGQQPRPELFSGRKPQAPSRWPKRQRGLQKMAVAVALAAALLLVAAGVWLWEREGALPRGGHLPLPDKTARRESLLAARLEGDARWRQVKGKTAQERLEVLSDIAHEVQGQAQALARSRSLEGLDDEVRLYREVITRMITTEAPQVAPAQRKRVLEPVAQRLAQTMSEAQRLSEVVPAAALPLRELAVAAQEGDRRLRALLRQTA